MGNTLSQRTNEAWIAALSGRDQESLLAVGELETYLRRALSKILVRMELKTEDIADLTQEALLRLVTYVHTFRGDSAFTTWATSVATRVAFTELRKRRVREQVHNDFDEVRDAALMEPGASLDDSLAEQELLGALHSAIEEHLTDRQKVAILAELRGVPTVEIAAQLGTNQNALYKLVHDARRKLREALFASGHTAESIHGEVAEEAR